METDNTTVTCYSNGTIKQKGTKAMDMTEALQNPHPEVPFAQIGDDNVSALAELAAIFKLKLRQTPAATLLNAPLKVIQGPCLAESSTPMFASLMPPPRQTR
jgi:hypothetical protein